MVVPDLMKGRVLIAYCILVLLIFTPVSGTGSSALRTAEVVDYEISGYFILYNPHNVTINDFVYVALPQNTSNQLSTVIRIEPSPIKYVSDEDGNLFAVVRVAAKPSEKVRVNVRFRVHVTGYDIDWSLDTPKAWPPFSVVSKYTGKTLYWNVYNATVVNLAYRVGFADTPLSVATKLAVWLVSRVRYQVNLGRAGSDRALRYGYGGYFVLGDCVEVADIYVTMARSLGLPARTAYGFLLRDYYQRMWLNMTTLREEGEAILQHWGGHMWPQVFIPPYGWIDVDMLDGMQPNVGSLSARHVIFGFEETKYYGSALTSSCIPSYLTLEYVEYTFIGRRI